MIIDISHVDIPQLAECDLYTLKAFTQIAVPIIKTYRKN